LDIKIDYSKIPNTKRKMKGTQNMHTNSVDKKMSIQWNFLVWIHSDFNGVSTKVLWGGWSRIRSWMYI